MDYNEMISKVALLKNNYSFLKMYSIGKSVLSKEILCLELGVGENVVICVGAHHALEWLTSLFLVKFTSGLCKHIESGHQFFGFNPQRVFEKSKIFIIPMLNPDGVDLVINGYKESYGKEIIKYNGGNCDFSKTWQANINGVDLNHNYDAAFYLSKKHGKNFPSNTRYGGKRPLSEPESRALANFTLKQNANIALAFHSQGEVIYYDFMDKQPKNAEQIGKLFEDISTYKIEKPESEASFGGYKDWFIETTGKYGFTIEVGLGKNPLPISQIDDIYKKNSPIILISALI